MVNSLPTIESFRGPIHLVDGDTEEIVEKQIDTTDLVRAKPGDPRLTEIISHSPFMPFNEQAFFGASRGGNQVERYEDGLTFLGGSQIDDSDGLAIDMTLGGSQLFSRLQRRELEKPELDLLRAVLEEIFTGGDKDLGNIDLDFLTNIDSGMPQTLCDIFVNKPGGGGNGSSAIRHIFKGDKSGGLHVPSFVDNKDHIDIDNIDPWKPFCMPLIVDGAMRVKVVHSNDGPTLVPHENSMFPAKMDNLSILMAITDAWENRSNIDLVGENEKYNSRIYEVPVDLEDKFGWMTIRLVTQLDSEHDKLRTAFPIVY